MLLLAVRAIARGVSADQLLAIGEADQISTGYAAPMMQFDYAAFGTEAGGKSHGNFYSLPIRRDRNRFRKLRERIGPERDEDGMKKQKLANTSRCACAV